MFFLKKRKKRGVTGAVKKIAGTLDCVKKTKLWGWIKNIWGVLKKWGHEIEKGSKTEVMDSQGDKEGVCTPGQVGAKRAGICYRGDLNKKEKGPTGGRGNVEKNLKPSCVKGNKSIRRN